jgi:hypothetical protein
LRSDIARPLPGLRAGKLVGLSMLWITIAVLGADEPQLPVMKDGLWETHSQQIIQGKKFETTIKMCKSHEMDKSMKAASENMRKTNQCTEAVTQLSASSWSSESHCESGPLKGTVSKSTVSYQGDTATHMEMHMTGSSENVTIMDSHYLGSCPADMKPGDAIMPDGTKMSMGAK